MLTILILAAGKGTRMRSKLPKVLQPLASKPLLGHVLDTASSLGADKVVVVHGHGAEAVRAAFPESSLAWALQEPQRGTGHAVQCAVPDMPDAGMCLVLYGDVPLIRAQTLRDLLTKATDGNLSLITAVLPDASGYGRIVRDKAGADGKVLRIVEHKDALAAKDHATLAIREMNSGILAAPTAWLKSAVSKLQSNNSQAELYLTDVIALAVAEGRVVHPHVVADEAEIAGVNDKLQLADLERALQRRIAHGLMREGVTLADPSRIDVRGSLTCGADVSIDVGCVFEGRVVLGEGVKVGPHVVMRDVEVAAGAEIFAFSHLDGATVGEAARIGPYARLRPGATLAREVHIGNFTEVKASDIGIGSKANHLAYIGDSTIGKNVNIGAGTITCNYDGANKHRTVIEDNVFVGSDSQLVAPVTLREGSTIAAGATITKEVPAGHLAITRVKPTLIPNWKRPTKTKR